jgi:hypothetical protein
LTETMVFIAGLQLVTYVLIVQTVRGDCKGIWAVQFPIAIADLTFYTTPDGCCTLTE